MTYNIPAEPPVELDSRLAAIVNSFLLKSPSRAVIERHIRNSTFVRFKDKRFPHLDFCGAIHIENGSKFVVSSRLINNERYSTYSRGYHTLSTKNPDKALANMLKNIAPFTYADALDKRRNLITEHIEDWLRGPKLPCQKAFQTITYTDFFDELMRIDREGTPFVHPKFKNALEVGRESFAESSRRQKVEGNVYYVTYQEDGVGVLTCPLRYAKQGELRVESNKHHYNEEEIPEVVKANVPLLKMLSDGENIQEIGIRVNDKEFFVIELLESNVR
jgi:hypothetical protein